MATRGLIEVEQRIASAAKRAGRDPEGVVLLAVSKGRSDAAVDELYEAGQRLFGENRPKGLLERMDGDLPEDIDWHFVGNVQRRAIKTIAPSIVLLHSLDRMSLADAWMRLEDPPPVLIEVNIGEEPQKHGFAPSEVFRVADHLATGGVSVRGLMIIPPRVRIADEARRWFVALREIRDALVVEQPDAGDLSMGMTDDFEVAVEEGASIVRVGRAIFEPGNDEINRRSLED
ncbi:MAG: YggS family pyridoxal phosphate-dependent enzyme [Actinomycetota bacterium]|nr:YggS family pyridoxal phosphate-dependent enzyme [Actinomycetota bacterium]